MQKDVDTIATALAIRIQGVNAPEEAAGNGVITAGRVLPWLQDTKAVNAWGLWQVDFRDVIVLDDENQVVAIYNLTIHNLGVDSNYVALRNILLTAAGTASPTAVRSLTGRRR